MQHWFGFPPARYGAALSPDSVGYIGAARNLLAGRGLVSYENGAPLVVQPPLYPLLLAGVAELTDLDPLQAARLVHIVLVAILLATAGLLVFRHLGQHPLLTHLTLGAILVAAPLVELEIAALSEAPFIVCLLLTVLCLEILCSRPTGRWLLAAAAAVALASLTRYIGVSLLLAGAAVIFFRPSQPVASRVRHTGTFVVLGGGPLALWLTCNYLVAGSMTGERTASTYSLIDNFAFLGATLWRWILYPEAPEATYFFVALAFIGLASMGLAFGWLRWLGLPAVWGAAPSLAPLVSTVASYLLFLLLTASVLAYDRIGSRLLAPIYIPLLLLLARSVAWWLGKIATPFSRRIVTLGVTAAGVLWLSVGAAMLWDSTEGRIESGAGGYSRSAWQENATIAYLREHYQALNCPIYSNAPDALYILADIPAQMSPLQMASSSTQTVVPLAELKDAWPAEGRACVVWLNRQERTYLYPLNELLSTVQIEQAVLLEDGSLHIVRRR